jgi:hypothetical protein
MNFDFSDDQKSSGRGPQVLEQNCPVKACARC